MAAPAKDRQNPAFYALIAVLIFMSVGPVLLLMANLLNLDVDISSGTGGLLFMPTIRTYETALFDILWYRPEYLRFCQIRFGGAFVNSMIIAPLSTALTLIMGTMAAYALVRCRVMGRDSLSL